MFQEAREAQELGKGPPLTEDAMLATWGQAPHEFSSDHRISDDGVEEFKQKENVRGAQGKSVAEELLDWDKRWLPPPCVWEDRGGFDTSFIPEYIRDDWLPNLTPGLVHFDLATDDFRFGRSAIDEAGKLADPIVHEDTLPGTCGIISP